MFKKLNILFFSTFPPRECGIATYTKNLIHSINKNRDNISVAAINDTKYTYDPIVKYQINQQKKSDYIKLAKKINKSNIDVISIQHEYGIFGGFNGHVLLEFLKNIKKPVVMTLHTVSIYQEKPFKIIPKRYKSRTKLLNKIISHVTKITVMTQTAKDYLIKAFKLSKNKIVVIPHGAPHLSKSQLKKYRQEKTNLGFSKDDFVILSWGLITPKKGLEYSIKAMPRILSKHPDKNIKYLIAGRYHPKKPKAYLDGLKKLVQQLGIKNNVFFDSRYLTYEEVYRYLSNAEIYITPYYAKEQASSGTLSYALAAGCAIVSTPYIFAKDVINYYQVGKLVNFKNSGSIAKTINYLIDNPTLIKKYKNNSYKFGQSIEWTKIGQKFIDTFKSVNK